MASTTLQLNVRNNLDEVLSTARGANRAALLLYITSGFPDEATTRRLLPVLADNGVDAIELGVPFSDPIADGPTIQRASTIALGAGMTFRKTLSILSDFRKSHQTPVILFGALNPFMAMGFEETATASSAACAEALLAADMPAEEAGELRDALNAKGLHLINLMAPTTPDGRLSEIAAVSSGFVYAIALKGTTGARSAVGTDIPSYLARVRALCPVPVALGFGIGNAQHVAAAVQAGADAVVVGSALIDLIEATASDTERQVREVGAFVRSLVAALPKR